MLIKKITIFILFLSFISLNKTTFSAGEKCPIEIKTPNSLAIYIKNVRLIERNMLNAVKDLKMKNYNGKLIDAENYRGNLAINPVNKKDFEKIIPFIRAEYFKISDRVTLFFHEAFNWNSFRAETIYYGRLAVFGEIPDPITRDFTLLKNEGKKIDRRLNYLIKKGYYNGLIDPKKLCNGVIGVCKFPESRSIGDAYTLLKNNNNKIIDIIMLSLYGDLSTGLTSVPNKEVGNNLYFVEKNFLDEISKYYNKHTMTDCSINGKGGYFKKAWNKIKQATDNAKLSNEVWKDWRDAMALAKGMPNEKLKYEEQERKLLSRELARQGLSSNASKAVLNNLDRFNKKGWYSMDNNFVANTINYGLENAKREIDRFNTFWEGTTRHNTEVISPVNFSKTNKVLNKSFKLEKEIAGIYEMAESFTQVNIEEEEKIKSRFRIIYLNLRTTIENLHEIEDMACKICETQAQNITNDFCCPKNSSVK